MGQGRRSAFIPRLIGLLAIIALMGIVMWSLWFETLLPFIKKNYLAGGGQLVGFSAAWPGAGLMAYGAWTIVRNTLRLFSENEVFQSNLGIVQGKRRPLSEQGPSKLASQARKETFTMLWNAWKPGLLWMALGWLALAVAGFFIGLAEGTISFR